MPRRRKNNKAAATQAGQAAAKRFLDGWFSHNGGGVLSGNNYGNKNRMGGTKGSKTKAKGGGKRSIQTLNSRSVPTGAVPVGVATTYDSASQFGLRSAQGKFGADSLVLSGHERVGAVGVGTLGAVTTGTILDSFFLSPENLGARVRQYSTLFQKYVFTRCSFEYVPGISVANAAANGQYLFAIDFDPADIDPEESSDGITGMFSWEFSKIFAAFSMATMPVNLIDPRKEFYIHQNYVEDGSQASDLGRRFSKQALVYIAAATDLAATPVSTGQLFFNYELIMYEPQLQLISPQILSLPSTVHIEWWTGAIDGAQAGYDLLYATILALGLNPDFNTGDLDITRVALTPTTVAWILPPGEYDTHFWSHGNSDTISELVLGSAVTTTFEEGGYSDGAALINALNTESVQWMTWVTTVTSGVFTARSLGITIAGAAAGNGLNQWGIFFSSRLGLPGVSAKPRSSEAFRPYGGFRNYLRARNSHLKWRAGFQPVPVSQLPLTVEGLHTTSGASSAASCGACVRPSEETVPLSGSKTRVCSSCCQHQH